MDGMERAHDAWWGGPLHLLLMLLVVALVVAGIVWLVRTLARPAPGAALLPVPPPPPAVAAVHDPAVAELRLRYARGEIDRDAYLATFADLTGRTEPWPGSGGSEAPTAGGPPAA